MTPCPILFLSISISSHIYAYECANSRKQILCPSKGSRPGLNLLGCDVDHSPASSAEVRNEWSYTSTPSVAVCLQDVCRNNFTVTFT